MITWDRAISDGTGTLSQLLTVYIFDFQRAFGHEPKLIVIPYFRMQEMDADLIMACADKEPRFRGVRFRLSLMSEAIELCGKDE